MPSSQTQVLDFLWRFRGSVPLGPSSTDEAVLDRVAAALERQRKPTRRRDGVLEFDSYLFSFAPNWLALVVYDHGRIWIDHRTETRTLRYDLSSLKGCMFCLVAAAIIAGFHLLGGRPLTGLKFGALVFGWLYGMNILIAALRVPGFFQRAVARA